jgi:uncharacterized YceG family protein
MMQCTNFKCRVILIGMILIIANTFAACSKPSTNTISEKATMFNTKSTDTITPTNTSNNEKIAIYELKVKEGMMLERDIIPKLCRIFSSDEKEVKNKLATADSDLLINKKLKDFRRMEGMIIPGEYKIKQGSTIDEYIKIWVSASEERYNRIKSSNIELNKLKPYERLILASMVDAECLTGTCKEEVATVFQNRLLDGAKLQSCVTAEYALGYQRPYLTGDDIKIASDYNTYYIKGLPAGPICAVSDSALKAASKRKMDSKIYYFYYDYIKNTMSFFDDFSKFQNDGNKSRDIFDKNSKVDKRAKINKQELYH